MLIDLLILTWYFGGLGYALWAWRLEFDLSLSTVLVRDIFMPNSWSDSRLYLAYILVFRAQTQEIPTITI